MNEYKELQKKFYQLNCDELTTEYYLYAESSLNKSQKETLKKEHPSKKVYLEDKLKYYNEMEFLLDKVIINYFTNYVKTELSILKKDKPLLKSKWVLLKEQESVKIEEKRLLMHKEISSLFNSINNQHDITNGYVKNYKNIYEKCKIYHTKKYFTNYPIKYWSLYGGSGREILQDDYEIKIFQELILKSKKENNLNELKKLYLKLIKYQIVFTDSFTRDVKSSIDKYLKKFDKKSLLDEIKSINRNTSNDERTKNIKIHLQYLLDL